MTTQVATHAFPIKIPKIPGVDVSAPVPELDRLLKQDPPITTANLNRDRTSV